MDTGVEFSISFVTCNRKRNTGGEIITYEKAVKNTFLHNKPQPNPSGTSPARKPNHFQNGTRNIRAAGTDQIRKVHIWLITRFNGKKVHW